MYSIYSTAYIYIYIHTLMSCGTAKHVSVDCTIYIYITPVLFELHWLPVEYRITYKILLLSDKALNGLAPSYLTDLLRVYEPTRQLRSSNQ